MREAILVGALVVLILACLSAVTLRRQDDALRNAVASVIVLSVAVPGLAPPDYVTVMSLSAQILILGLAILRQGGQVLQARLPLLLVAFFVWSTIFGELPGTSETASALYIAEGLFYALLIVAVSALRVERNPMQQVLPLLIIAQFVAALSEQFLQAEAIWPRVDGTNDITRRNNTLVPALVGRSMGSTSYPITLGILAGIALVACIWQYREHRRRVYLWLGLLSAATVVMSGTRTAVVASALCVGVILITNSSGRVRAFRIFLTGLFGLIMILLIDPLALVGLDDIEGTSSYTHRLGVLGLLPELLQRPWQEVLFGTGYRSIGPLLSGGALLETDGIAVLDQQFIRVLVGCGLVGLVLMVLSVAVGFMRGNGFERLTIAFLVFSFLTYDTLSWRLLAVLLIVAACAPSGRMMRFTRPHESREVSFERQ